jgi:hypothetical protein
MSTCFLPVDSRDEIVLFERNKNNVDVVKIGASKNGLLYAEIKTNGGTVICTNERKMTIKKQTENIFEITFHKSGRTSIYKKV